MVLVVFQTVEVLVAFAAVIAAVGLVLLHTHSARVGGEGVWVDDRVSAVVVGMKLLGIVSVL